MFASRKPLPTEEIGFRILEAIRREGMRSPMNRYARMPMDDLAQLLMKRYKWDIMDFGRGWNLVLNENLIDGRKLDGKFYAWLTMAGQDYFIKEQSERQPFALSPGWACFFLAIYILSFWGMTVMPVPLLALLCYYVAVLCSAMFIGVKRPGC